MTINPKSTQPSPSIEGAAMSEVAKIAASLRRAVTESGGIDLRDPDLLRQAASTLEAQAARIATLETALEPFARQAQIFDDYDTGQLKFTYTEDFEPFDLTGFGTRIVGLTVGDLRRARASLAQKQEGRDER